MVNKFYFPPNLPISSLKDELIGLIQNNQVLIVAGETGSGKTTQLPKLCLAAECVREKKAVACTQPRRIAASSVAKRVSEELGEYGDMVGYRVRFVDRTHKNTKIKFLTDGLLLAEAASDKYLNKYDVIIIDEAHERSLNIDFLLGLLKKLLPKRPELKVIISSATLDTEKFSKFFSNAKIASIPGKTFPIEVRYSPPNQEGMADVSIVDEAVEAIKEVLVSSRTGDILVFMPTERDIVETVDCINSGAGSSDFLPGAHQTSDFEAMPLFGRMSVKAQGAIFRQSKKRKIVVATNVAETSITVPGIRFVIDSGLARIATYSPKMRNTKLPVQAISTSSADQRKGRCGRIGPGICIRLYSEENYQNRPEHTPPEIIRSNLAEVILRMVNLRLGHPSKFPFIDPPNKRSIKDGLNLLAELGAIKNSNHKHLSLTKRGRIMARLPLDPCLSRIVLEARERNVLNQIIIIVAALSIQDPRIRPLGEEKKADAAHQKFVAQGSDFVTYLNLWNAFHHVAKKVKSMTKLRKYCRQNYLAFQRMREWMDIYEQICRGLEEETQFPITNDPENYDAIHQSLLSGLLRNIAVKKDKKIFTGAYGKEVMIFPGSAQFKHPPQWVLAAEVVETNRLYARTVGAIDPKWLEKIAGNLCKHSYSEPHWEKKRGQVVAYEKTTLFGLVINERRKVNFGKIDHKAAREIFIQSALVEGQVNRKIDFLDRNNELIEALQEIEDKVRARHIIDEYTIFAFYDSRIPEQIITIADLVRALPELRSSLTMSEDDLINIMYDHNHLEKFPETVTFDSFSLKLFYKFDPASSEDGVSVLIPTSELHTMDPVRFEWLVPGLLYEKVLALLKSLPKGIRKHLVPVNQTADVLFSELEFAKDSLLAQLSTLLLKKYQLKVERKDWQPDLLPNYLKMRFCLVNAKGHVVKHSRDFNELFEHQDTLPAVSDFKQVKIKWEKDSVEHLDDDLPQRLPLETTPGNITGYVFPGYIAKGNGIIGIKLFSSTSDQIQNQKQALLEFYKQALAKQVKVCTKELKFVQSDWPLFNWLGSSQDVNSRVQDFIFLELFDLHNKCFQTREEFDQKVHEYSKDGLFRAAAFEFNRLKKILEARRQCFDVLTKFSTLAHSNSAMKSKFETFFDDLDRLLPDDFLTVWTMTKAEQNCRYMEALQIRAERAYVSLATDTKKLQSITPFYKEIEKLNSRLGSILVPARKKLISDLLDELSIMLEEFKISVFSPEMKTLCKVSEKRLLKKIGEISKQL